MLRVDQLPWYLLLPVAFFGYAFACLLWLYLQLVRLTCRVSLPPDSLPPHAVFCTWHENLPAFFVTFPDLSRQAWLNHPAWFMKPIHVLLRIQGLKYLFLGSSGHGGQIALERLQHQLKQGFSTSLNPDGPAGPPYTLRPGALRLSEAAQIPVVALRYRVQPAWRLGGWDRKWLPMPFGTLQMEAENLGVLRDSPEDAARLKQALSRRLSA
jgi:lysophospholipid acyltransferase (LPLAT)-like uncharacterized protein